MKVCFYPYKNDTNQYIYNTIQALQKQNIEVYDLVEAKKNVELYNEIRVIHLNWFESISAKKTKDILLEYMKRPLQILKLKYVKKKKIVWTFHNKIPHDAKFNKLSRLFMKFMICIVDAIMIHSHESKQVICEYVKNDKIKDKIYYVEHGNYIGSYNKEEMQVELSKKINEDDTVFLFIGAVRPYKNIEMLINVLNELRFENCKLIIAGKPIHKEYEEQLHGLIGQNKNIMTEFRFIPDEQLIHYLDLSDIVILPYDKSSSLNSGTVFLAFSNKKTIICPLIGTIKDLTGHDFYYTYDYHSQEEHYDELKKVIEKAHTDILKDPDCFKRMGCNAFEYVKKHNNWGRVGEKIKDIYINVCK